MKAFSRVVANWYDRSLLAYQFKFYFNVSYINECEVFLWSIVSLELLLA